jgi:hypothetical protein
LLARRASAAIAAPAAPVEKTAPYTKAKPEKPTWATIESPNEKTCSNSAFYTADCAVSNILAQINAAETFAYSRRLAYREGDGQYKKDQHDKPEKIDKLYPDREVQIRSRAGDSFVDKKVSIPNPYKALAKRETTFASPSTNIMASTDPDVKRNVDILKQIADDVIIQDRPFAIALLESLWFCANEQTLDDNPLCQPLKALELIREYKMEKEVIQELHSSWFDLSLFIRAVITVSSPGGSPDIDIAGKYKKALVAPAPAVVAPVVAAAGTGGAAAASSAASSSAGAAVVAAASSSAAGTGGAPKPPSAPRTYNLRRNPPVRAYIGGPPLNAIPMVSVQLGRL